MCKWNKIFRINVSLQIIHLRSESVSHYSHDAFNKIAMFKNATRPS